MRIDEKATEDRDRIVAKLLRILADQVDDHGVEGTISLLLPSRSGVDEFWKSVHALLEALETESQRRDTAARGSRRAKPFEAATNKIAPSTAQEDTPERRLIPLSNWSEYHDWPPQGGLRHLVFHSDRNGFDKVIRRAGRRILIDEQAFFEWIDTDASKPWKVEPKKEKTRR